MKKGKRMLILLARGGMSQSEIAGALHVSKREVSLAAKVVKDLQLDADTIELIAEDVAEELVFPKTQRVANDAYLSPDLEAFIERKKCAPRIPVKMFWMEYCECAAFAGKSAYSYQTFAKMFAEASERSGATRHFEHVPGRKAYIDWAGDKAYLTDRITRTKIAAYALVVALPFSQRFWCEFFMDMRQRSWQYGQIHAFEDFGGVPHMLVPDNAATATDRSGNARVTLVNREYERFAEHYGTAVVPARVRRPRDKSAAEGMVNLVEQWIIAPARERTFYTLEELNEFCLEQLRWLNERPFSAKDGSRMSIFNEEEAGGLLPLPSTRYEMCEWRSAKVAPDYHVRVDNMNYSVPHELIGRQVDVKLTEREVFVMEGGCQVARHKRLYGRRGQYSTLIDHMPESHAALDDPWSAERFLSWARRIGTHTEETVRKILASRAIPEQAYVPCRNVLGLSKTYTPKLLECACERVNATCSAPSYTACKNAILAIRSAQSGKAEASARLAADVPKTVPHLRAGCEARPPMRARRQTNADRRALRDVQEVPRQSHGRQAARDGG